MTVPNGFRLVATDHYWCDGWNTIEDKVHCTAGGTHRRLYYLQFPECTSTFKEYICQLDASHTGWHMHRSDNEGIEIRWRKHAD